MSRRAVGSRVLWGEPKRRAQQLDAALREAFGPVDPDKPLLIETTPLGPLPDYVWDKSTFRFRWRRGASKDGKNVSWHFCKVPPLERKLYEARLQQRRKAHALAKGGSRLKKRS